MERHVSVFDEKTVPLQELCVARKEAQENVFVLVKYKAAGPHLIARSMCGKGSDSGEGTRSLRAAILRPDVVSNWKAHVPSALTMVRLSQRRSSCKFPHAACAETG
jgi:hypothetical protein